MWVQEGSDCKDSEESTSTSHSIFTRGIYSFLKPKTTVSTTGIRMVPPTPKTSPQKARVSQNGQHGLPAADEKELETEDGDQAQVARNENDEEDVSALSYLRSTSSRPITPAKFLENMSRRDEDEKTEDNVPIFGLGDHSADDKGSESQESDNVPISNVFELDCDAAGDSGDSPASKQSFDLCLVGTKMPILHCEENQSEDHHEEPPTGTRLLTEDRDTAKEDDSGKLAGTLGEGLKSLEERIPQKSSALDVKRWSEWTECIEFSKQSGLVVVEVYSVVFGPSEALYPFIEQMVRHKAGQIQFVRLSLHTMSTMEVVHEAIVDHKDYFPSPVPVFLLIKNGKKVGQLTGTKPAELATMIEKYATMQQRADTAPVSPVTVKYRSILERKAAARTSSSMFQTPRKGVFSSNKGENIRNLLRTQQCGQIASESEHASPTKLWKNEMLLVD